MAERFVVDNSVVMAWCFEDQASRYSDAVLDRLVETEALVPGIWPLEVTNVLSVAGRKGRLGKADATRFIELLRNLPIVVEQELPGRVFSEVFALAHDTGLSSYDASYLDLAMRAGIPIATLDKAVRKSARRCRVQIFGQRPARYKSGDRVAD